MKDLMIDDKKEANDILIELRESTGMNRKQFCETYHFLGEHSLEFEDSKTVKELIEYAFENFDYYEPFGMDYVTVFQMSSSR